MNKFKTVNEYLRAQSKEAKGPLEKIRQAIKKTVPGAEEVISYGMPAFKFHGMLIFYAAFKNHYSIFAPRAVAHFKEELKKYKTARATVQFPYGSPPPLGLIKRMVRFTARFNLDKAKMKELMKKAKNKK